MVNGTIIDCGSLASRTNFPNYIAKIRNATASNFALIDQCKTEVCNALWGSGNPDISGVGMIVGYIIENVIGLVLVSLLYTLLLRTSKKGNTATSESLVRYISVIRRGCSSFYDCAVFFTFSVQLACIVVLVRLDFGINASGMGDSTAKVTWAVSLLTILPLIHVAFNPSLLRESHSDHVSTIKGRKSQERKEQLRFLLFALCWLLFIYPFLSRMTETFGPSAIGGKSQVISTNDWNMIEAACTVGIDALSNHEVIAIDFFSVAGSVFVCLLALAKIIWLALQRHHKNSWLLQRLRARYPTKDSQLSRLSIVIFTAVPAIAISQIWTIFRLRSFQQQMAQNAGNDDTDNQWTFGQIAAVTIFVPVAVECCFAWLYD